MVIQALLMVTLLASNLEQTADSYRSYFGYTVVDSGIINSSCAKQIGDARMNGREFIIMRPPDGEPEVLLRFIGGANPSYQPMLATGWNAIELLAKDPDSLREQLQGKDFEVIGEPTYLTPAKNIYAMQVKGPSNELVYLTKMVDPSQSLLKPRSPLAPVGGTFIVVIGSKDLEETRSFLEGLFDNFLTKPMQFKIDILSRARGVASDTDFPIMLLKFAGPFGFEFDEYRNESKSQSADGGIVLVSASVNGFIGNLGVWSRKPSASHCPHIAGPSGLITLPSGAKLELLFN